MRKLIEEPHSIWTEGEGQYSEIVLSSRVRLARNLAQFPFPLMQTEASANAVLERLDKVFANSKELKLYRMSEIPELERQALVEKHLISPEHVQKPENKGIIVNREGSISIMVNEEDHLRIQCFASGLELETLLAQADKIDDEIEKEVNYAYDEQYGYLTCCPTNLGTGMRVSVMMHLPGLVLTNQAGVIFSQLSKLGIAVRGLFGEGTDAHGNLFQISNQITLGQDEKEIIENISSVAKKLVSQEQAARNYLLNNAGPQVEDKARRAYGILTNAKLISSQEALGLISDLRLGKALGVINELDLKTINELYLLCQPGYLQVLAKGHLDPQARDIKRAEIIKEKLAKF
ncbi:MAG: protein arginine kinase [Clostridia bacterium]|nr:protein arginine kinase [Clostridia bacterium]